MAKPVTVTLIDPIEGHGELITKLVIQSPGWREHSVLGDPVQAYRSSDGSIFTVEKDDVIRAYIEKLTEAPFNPVMLNSLSLADSIQCREALLSFFGQAREKISNAPATSSSST